MQVLAWLWIVLAIILLLWLLIYLLPDIFLHHLQWGGLFGRRDGHQVALTFDDGPGPLTESVLDVLAAHGVHATFFVVGDNVQKLPDVIHRMVADGHEIALHGRRHVSAYLCTPWATFREIGLGLKLIEDVAGVRPTKYRPPWGHMNLGSWLAMRYYRLKPVIWQVAPDDWRAELKAEIIARRVVQWSQPGVIIVLHDAGGDRQRTLASLPPMIEGLRRLGMEPVSVEQMAADPSYFRKIWMWWEIRFTKGWHVESVPSSSGGDPVLRVGVIRYKGPNRVLSDRTLHTGAKMAEIHFGNPALSQLSAGSAGGLRAFHLVMRGFSDLARFVEDHPDYRDVVALGGVTLLDARTAIERLGFQRYAVQGWQKWSMWVYLIVLMSIYHHAGWSTLRRFFRLRPVLVVISRDELMRRYGKDHKRHA